MRQMQVHPFLSKLGSVYLSQSFDWPLSQYRHSWMALNDREKIQNDLMVVQWYSAQTSQPHSAFLLAGIQVTQHLNNKFKGWPRSHWELALPPARRAKTLLRQSPSGADSPFIPSAWSSSSGGLQKLKNQIPNFVGGSWILSLTSAIEESFPCDLFGSRGFFNPPFSIIFDQEYRFSSTHFSSQL